MCDPVLFGTAAATTATSLSTGGTAIALAGSAGPTLAAASMLPTAAAIGPTTLFTTTGATAGLFGSGGAFTWGATLNTLGTLGGAMSSLYGAGVQSANYKYQQHMMNYDAKIKENDALMKMWAAENEADIYDERLKRHLAGQDTRYAKSNVVINQDTPLQIAEADAVTGAAERAAILYRGKIGADADRAAAVGSRFGAGVAGQNARSATTSGYLNAATTIGTGAYRGGLLS